MRDKNTRGAQVCFKASRQIDTLCCETTLCMLQSIRWELSTRQRPAQHEGGRCDQAHLLLSRVSSVLAAATFASSLPSTASSLEWRRGGRRDKRDIVRKNVENERKERVTTFRDSVRAKGRRRRGRHSDRMTLYVYEHGNKSHVRGRWEKGKSKNSVLIFMPCHHRSPRCVSFACVLCHLSLRSAFSFSSLMAFVLADKSGFVSCRFCCSCCCCSSSCCCCFTRCSSPRILGSGRDDEKNTGTKNEVKEPWTFHEVRPIIYSFTPAKFAMCIAGPSAERHNDSMHRLRANFWSQSKCTTHSRRE